MGKRTGTQQEPKESVNVKREKIIQIGTIVVALITLIGVGINVYGSYRNNMIPIYAAQTAEVKLTELALSFTSTFTSTPSPTFTITPTFTETLTPSPTFTPTPEPISLCTASENSTSADLYIVNVPAVMYWCNTGIEVKKGQRLEFEAEGEWLSGISRSGPDGDDKDRCNDFILCDNLGVLVGSIGEPNTDRNALNNINIAFKIGSAIHQDIQIDGTLFLSMNDNIQGCQKGTPDGCFLDNRFFVKVTITVRQ